MEENKVTIILKTEKHGEISSKFKRNEKDSRNLSKQASSSLVVAQRID